MRIPPFLPGSWPSTGSLLLLTTCTLVACSGDDDACGSALALCDIRDAGCQTRIYQATACMREQEPEDRPPVRVITVAEFESELRARIQDGDAQEYDAWGAALALLGVIAPSADLEESQIATLVDQVAAFYEPGNGRVTVIDHGFGASSEDSVYVLSHEFTHALQDQQIGLGPFQQRWISSLDSNIAVTAVIEGEAMFISTGVLLQIFGEVLEDYPWDQFSDRILGRMFADMDASTDPLVVATELAPYPLGLRLVSDAWLRAGQAGIDALYEAPPLSTAEVLSATDERGGKVDMSCYPTAAPAGYVGFDHDSFGLLGPFSLSSLESGALSAWPDSRAWQDDHLVLFVPEGADPTQVALAWRLKWATTAAATDFEAVAAMLLPDALVSRTENEVLIQAATDPLVLAAWADAGCGTEADLPDATEQSTMTAALRRRVIHGPLRGRLARP